MYAFNAAEFNAGLHYAAPEIFLSAAACALLMLDLFLTETGRRWTGALAVLALLAANSFEQLIQTVTTDFAILLDIDVVTLCIESSNGFARAPLPGLLLLEPGDVEALLGPTRDALLEDEVAGDAAIFGAGAGLVQSEALLRLNVANAPPGLLALGTRRAGKFKPGQGTELLCFLAQTLGVTISQWLDL